MCALKLKTFQQLKVNKSHTLPKRGMVGMQMWQPTFGWYLLFSTQSKKFLTIAMNSLSVGNRSFSFFVNYKKTVN